jgi:hypothetical protein
MAYNPTHMSALTYANGFTLWHYRTNDVAIAVDTSGYFNAAAGMLRVGDFILANTDTGAATPTHGIYIVTSNSGGVVDVSNPQSLGSVNSD